MNPDTEAKPSLAGYPPNTSAKTSGLLGAGSSLGKVKKLPTLSNEKKKIF